jgi:hypothetical protein
MVFQLGRLRRARTLGIGQLIPQLANDSLQ